MQYSRFLSFNVIGGMGWVLSMTLAGYYLGSFPVVRGNFEKVVIGIVFLSVAPMAIHYFKARRAAS
jgi:membrane-associated protein